MTRTKLIATGAIGAVVAAVCCATPILAVVLAAVGLSAVPGYLDYVLLAAIAICIGVMIYGLTKRKPA
jgi:mercuric ion transport protein